MVGSWWLVVAFVLQLGCVFFNYNSSVDRKFANVEYIDFNIF